MAARDLLDLLASSASSRFVEPGLVLLHLGEGLRQSRLIGLLPALGRALLRLELDPLAGGLALRLRGLDELLRLAPGPRAIVLPVMRPEDEPTRATRRRSPRARRRRRDLQDEGLIRKEYRASAITALVRSAPPAPSRRRANHEPVTSPEHDTSGGWHEPDALETYDTPIRLHLQTAMRRYPFPAAGPLELRDQTGDSGSPARRSARRGLRAGEHGDSDLQTRQTRSALDLWQLLNLSSRGRKHSGRSPVDSPTRGRRPREERTGRNGKHPCRAWAGRGSNEVATTRCARRTMPLTPVVVPI